MKQNKDKECCDRERRDCSLQSYPQNDKKAVDPSIVRNTTDLYERNVWFVGPIATIKAFLDVLGGALISAVNQSVKESLLQH